MGAHTQQAIKQFLTLLVSIPTAIPRITISKLQKHVVPPERGLQAKKQMPSYISRPACWSHGSPFARSALAGPMFHLGPLLVVLGL